MSKEITQRGPRKLQVRAMPGQRYQVVDKETGEAIDGVVIDSMVIEHSFSPCSTIPATTAKFQILLTDPNDIWVEEEVEGSVVKQEEDDEETRRIERGPSRLLLWDGKGPLRPEDVREYY